MKVQPENPTLMRKLATRLWRDDRGQSTTEYILILSVVVMIAMKFKTTFQAKLLTAVNQLGDDIDKTISTTDSGQ